MRTGAVASGLLTLLVSVVLLSGCVDEPAPIAEIEEPAPVDPTIPPLNRTVHKSGCVLYSQAYPAPAEPLRGYVPEGFELAEGGRVPGTTNVAVYVTICQAVDEQADTTGNVSTLGESTVEVLSAVPVIPPESERDDNVTRNYVPLTLAVQGDDLHARYRDWGFALAEATNVTHAYSNDGTVFQTSIAWTDGTGSYTVDAAGQAIDIKSPHTYYRLWAAPDDGKVVGSLLVENAAGRQIGSGAASFAYDGSGAAPPHAVGTTSDANGIEGYVQYVPLGAKVPALVASS